jgi:hypothetical protein
VAQPTGTAWANPLQIVLSIAILVETMKKAIHLGKYPLPKRPIPDYQSPHAEPIDVPPSPAPTPLAIILATMHRKHAEGDLDGAVALARIAAPYVHPRVPSAAPPSDLTTMQDADLDAIQPPS